MKTVSLTGSPRTEVGKKATKEVRNQGLIPCVLYGKDEVVHFSTKLNDVKHLIYTPEFKIAEITVEGKSHRCIVKDTQFHPVTDQLLHIDFLKLIDGRPVKVNLPVSFYGDSPGLKVGGKLLQNLRRVKIKTTPENLVEELKLDISGLDLGQAIRIRDIEVNENIEIMVAPGTPVATVEIPRALRAAAAAAAKEEGN